MAKSPHVPNVSHSLTSSHSRWLLRKFKKTKKIFVSKFRLFSGSFWSILNFDFLEQRYNHCYIHIYSLRPYFCIHYFLNTHRFPNRTHRYRYSYRAHLCFQSVRHSAVKLHPLQSLASMSIRKNRRDLYRSSSHRNYEFLNNIFNANTHNEEKLPVRHSFICKHRKPSSSICFRNPSSQMHSNDPTLLTHVESTKSAHGSTSSEHSSWSR